MSLLPRHGVAGRLAREPLVHFLVIGAALLLLTSVRGNDTPPPAPATVVITKVDVARLVDGWTTAQSRPPTSAELGDLIESQVRTEILSREALALGLDRDDGIVRRRLAEKMTLLASGAGEGAAPTAEQAAVLEEWYRTVREQYVVVVEDASATAGGAAQTREEAGPAPEGR